MEELYNLILNNEETFFKYIVKGKYYDNSIPFKDRVRIFEFEGKEEVIFKLVDDGEGVSHFYISLDEKNMEIYDKDYFEIDFLDKKLFIHWYDEWMD